MLPPEASLLLVLQVVEGGREAVTHVVRGDDFVDIAVLGGDIRVEVLLFVFGDELLARFGRSGRRGDFLAVKDVDGTFGSHHGELGDRQREHIVGTEVLAVHGDVGATVGLAEDKRHLRHGRFGVGVQKLGAMAVREAEKWIAECGYKKIVIDSRLEATGFYEKLGYKLIGDQPHRWGVFDCTRMEKTL